MGWGIGVGIGWPNSSTINYDSSTIAFIGRVKLAGGSLSILEKNAVNQLVVDLKAYGLWDSMKAIYPMVGTSAAACAQNLKSSSFTGTFTSGWTFASTGVTGNGTSTYMNTSLNINTSLTSASSLHLSYYSRTNNTVNNTVFMGCTDGTTQTYVMPCFNSNTSRYVSLNATGGTLTTIIPNTLGFLIEKRENSTNVKTIKNGSLISTTASTSVTKTSANVYIGAYNGNGTSFSYSSLHECAFASIGDGLTDTQAANFYTAVQAFQTTLSRQV